MLTLLKNELKMLLRRKQLLIFLSIILIYLNYLAISIFSVLQKDGFSIGLVSSYASKWQGNDIIVFFGVLFFSYEYLRGFKDSGLEEIVGFGNSFKKVFLSKMIVPIFAMLLMISSIFLYDIYGLIVSGIDMVFVKHILCHYLLNFILPSLLAILISVFIAFKLGGIKGYTYLFGLAFIILPTSSVIISNLKSISYFFEYIKKAVSFFVPNINFVFDNIYGLPMEYQRFALVISWILLFIILIITLFKFKQKITRYIMVGVCLLVTLPLFNYAIFSDVGLVHKEESQIGYSFSSEDNALTSMSDTSYLGWEIEQSDFSVESYELKFDITDKLYATAKMTLDKPVESAAFTLYFHYDVSDVYDENGNKLQFTNEGNYIDIWSTEEFETITIVYSGFSSNYYSNSQGIFLPGDFAFYPIAGKYYLDGYGCYETSQQIYNFDVEINTTVSYECTLTEQGSSYKGDTNHFSIIGGMIKTDEEGGTVSVSSIFANTNNTFNMEYALSMAYETLSYIGIDKELETPDIKTIVIGNNCFVGGNQIVLGDNYILSKSSYFDYEMLSNILLIENGYPSYINDKLLLLYNFDTALMYSYSELGEIEYSNIMPKSENDTSNYFSRMLEKVIRASNPEDVEKEMYKYFIGEYGDISPTEFLNSLVGVSVDE